MRWSRMLATIVATAVVGGVVAAADPAPAGAAIASTSGAVRVITAPASVRPGALVSKSSIAAFSENQSVVLSSSLTVDGPVVGTRYTSRSQVPTRTLAAGTVLASHFLHADVKSGSKTFQGRIVFDREIAGLLTTDGQLDATDAIFRVAPTLYPTGTARRGVELASGEWFRLVDSHTVEVRLQVSTLDQLRVLTYANRPPVAAGESYTTAEDTALDVAAPGVLANDSDPDGQALTVSVTQAPTNGTVALASNGSFRYVPANDFAGTDSFVYAVTDGAASASATATVTVTPVDDPPVTTTTTAPTATPPDAVDDDAAVTEGEPLDVAAPGVLANDDAGSGGAMTATVVEAPTSGTVELTDEGGYRYRPNPGHVGTDRFTYRASNAAGSDTAVVSIKVEPMTMAFSSSALEGGSIVNVVAFDPRLDGTVLAGSDVAGLYRSTDWGATWRAVNAGVYLLPTVAALQFSPTVPGKVYAALGNGSSGGIAVSVDGGVTWETRPGAARFNGGTGRPGRVTGHLLAFDDARGLLYAATWNQGVLRSADDGHTWQATGLSGADLRSLVIDPANPDVLYATTYMSGVYRTTNASAATPTWTALASSPRDVEELRMIGGSLYGAAGVDGVFSSSDGGATWQRLGSGPTVAGGTAVSNGPAWVSITGYETASGTTLYAGALNPARNGDGYDSVVRSTDGGATWTSLTQPTAVHRTIGGPSGQQWWWDGNGRLGGPTSWANHLEVAPGTPDRIMVAGRMDIYASADGGGNWYPMVEGLGVTVNRGVAVDPNRPSRVYVPTMDWVSVYSDDGLRDDVHRSTPAGATNPRTLALDTSTNPSTVYLGTGDMQSNTNGELYSNTDPATQPWVSEGLGVHTGNRRVIGVAAGSVQGERIVLAVVEQSGLWRKSGDSWTQVSTAVTPTYQGIQAGSWFAWHPGSSTVFLFDRATGVWRSSDAGRTWTMIWQRPSTWTNTGYLAVDPTDPTTLYVSAGFAGLHRLDDATTGTVGAGITATQIPGFAGPGPIAFDRHGRLYVASPSISEPSRLSMSTDGGLTWRELGDDVWRNQGVAPFFLDVAPDGTLYAAMRGMGVLIGDRR